MADAPDAEAQRRVAMVRQVGGAIGELARHMSTSADVAREISAVSARAKAIAFKAWQVMSGGHAGGQATTELIADLTKLAEEMSTLAGRAGREAIVSKEAASVLAMAASEFVAVANDTRAIDSVAKLRERLRPLLGQLETIPQRLVEGKAITDAFAQTSKTATALAVRGKQLQATGKPGQVLQSLYDGVTALADQTGSLSVWITANAEQTQRVAGMIATSVEQVARPRGAPAEQVKTEGLGAIIKRGGAIVW